MLINIWVLVTLSNPIRKFADSRLCYLTAQFPPFPDHDDAMSLIEDLWNGNGRHPDVNIVPCSLLRQGSPTVLLLERLFKLEGEPTISSVPRCYCGLPSYRLSPGAPVCSSLSRRSPAASDIGEPMQSFYDFR